MTLCTRDTWYVDIANNNTRLKHRFIRQVHIDQCLMENQNTQAGHKALALLDMSFAFVILGIGLSLSILVFLLEIIYKRIQTRFSIIKHK